MRFLFCDRILALEPGRRLLASKTVSISEEFLPGHYSLRPVMPAILMLECLAQAGGWLYIVTEKFGVRTVLGMVEGVRVRRHAIPGDRLLLDVQLEFQHRDGATVRGKVLCGEEVLMEADRLVFASQRIDSPSETSHTRELFAYIKGDFQWDGMPL